MLSDPPLKMKFSAVKSWAKSIPPGPAKPATSQAISVKTGKSYTNHSSTTPGLLSATSCAASSILTNAITITSTQDPIKIKQDPDSIYVCI